MSCDVTRQQRRLPVIIVGVQDRMHDVRLPLISLVIPCLLKCCSCYANKHTRYLEFTLTVDVKIIGSYYHDSASL